MNYPVSLFPFWMIGLTSVLALVVLAVAALRAPWRALQGPAANAWLGAVVLVMVVWLLKGGFKPGVSFHLLGVSVLALMMGPWLALVAVGVVLLGLVMDGQGEWLAIGMNFMVSGVVPVALTSLVLRIAQHSLPRNLFVYVFANAFMAGGAAYAAANMTGMLLMGAVGSYPWDYLLEDVLPFQFLFSWSEAFTTGLVMAVLVVYRPEWVASFDDALYLDDKPR